MKKIKIQAYCAYPIFIDHEIEVENTDMGTLEEALADLCEKIISDSESRPMPAIMDGPTFTEL